MRLFLDDIRLTPSGFVAVRTAADAIGLLKTDRVSVVSFDHDLGQGKSGLDVINAIEEDLVTGFLDLPIMLCHSSNAPGRANIERAISAVKARAWEAPYPGWGFLARAVGPFIHAHGMRLIAKAFGKYPGYYVQGPKGEIPIEVKGGVFSQPVNLEAGMVRLMDRGRQESSAGVIVAPDRPEVVVTLASSSVTMMLVDDRGNARLAGLNLSVLVP